MFRKFLCCLLPIVLLSFAFAESPGEGILDRIAHHVQIIAAESATEAAALANDVENAVSDLVRRLENILPTKRKAVIAELNSNLTDAAETAENAANTAAGMLTALSGQAEETSGTLICRLRCMTAELGEELNAQIAALESLFRTPAAPSETAAPEADFPAKPDLPQQDI